MNRKTKVGNTFGSYLGMNTMIVWLLLLDFLTEKFEGLKASIEEKKQDYLGTFYFIVSTPTFANR